MGNLPHILFEIIGQFIFYSYWALVTTVAVTCAVVIPPAAVILLVHFANRGHTEREKRTSAGGPAAVPPSREKSR